MSVILLTGSSGFLGQTIKKVLSNYDIISLARTGADIIVDLAKEVPSLLPNDIVIHVAGKAHSVPRNDMECQDFFNINVTGTANLLKGLENNLPTSFVFISSVSVYGLESGMLISEDAPLLAKDPYGRSKIEAERLVAEWCKRNSVIYTILRLPLIAGSNPPGNLGAMITGIKKGYYFNIGGGKAKKSIVLVEDVAKIILSAASVGGVYNLTDRHHPTFFELSSYIAQKLNKSKPLNIPKNIAVILANVGDLLGNLSPFNSRVLNKIMADLTFDDTKAVSELNWRPRPVLESFEIS